MEENKKHLNSREHFISTPIYLDIQHAKYKSCIFSCLVHSESFFSCLRLSDIVSEFKNSPKSICWQYVWGQYFVTASS